MKGLYVLFINIFERLARRLVASYFVIHKLEQDLHKNPTLEEMIDYVKNYSYIFYSRLVAKFLLAIFKYSQEQLSSIEVVGKEQKKLYILHVCVWGEEYTSKMMEFLIPSLLSFGNLPSICADFTVQLIIHCDLKTKKILQSKSSMTMVEEYASIIYKVIPEDIFKFMNAAQSDILTRMLSKISNVRPDWKYTMLGCLQNISMMYAQKNRAYISFLMPDFIFSNQAFSRLLMQVKKGKNALVATSFRTLDNKVKMEVARYYEGHILNVPSEILTTIAVKCMHISAQHRIISKNNHTYQVTAQLIFHYPGELVVRALHYHPLVVNFNDIQHVVKFCYHPIDAMFLCDFVDYNSDLSAQIGVIEDPNYVGMMEVSRSNIEYTCGRKEGNIYSRISNYLSRSTWNALNKYLISKRCVYKYKDNIDYIISEVHDSEIIKPLLEESL